ncbi:MAG: hypothetical protein M5U34_31760 [Chloroflexi bacterium]|nr:hypothetical protein [Chloroflexota bacterium]
MREEHMARIQEAQSIVKTNVETLLAMVETVGKILREIDDQRENPETPPA